MSHGTLGMAGAGLGACSPGPAHIVRLQSPIPAARTWGTARGGPPHPPLQHISAPGLPHTASFQSRQFPALWGVRSMKFAKSNGRFGFGVTKYMDTHPWVAPTVLRVGELCHKVCGHQLQGHHRLGSTQHLPSNQPRQPQLPGSVPGTTHNRSPKTPTHSSPQPAPSWVPPQNGCHSNEITALGGMGELGLAFLPPCQGFLSLAVGGCVLHPWGLGSMGGAKPASFTMPWFPHNVALPCVVQAWRGRVLAPSLGRPRCRT